MSRASVGLLALFAACSPAVTYDDGSVVFDVPATHGCMSGPTFTATPEVLATDRLTSGAVVSCGGTDGMVWAIRLYTADPAADAASWLSTGERSSTGSATLSGGEATRFVDTVQTDHGPRVRVARVRRTAVEVQIAAVLLEEGGRVSRADAWLDGVRFIPLSGRQADDLCDGGTPDDCLWAGMVHADLGDRVRAAGRYEFACERDQGEGCRRAALLARESGDGASARWFEAGCEAGDAVSCRELAVALDAGDDLDQRRATRWLVRACELGESASCAHAAGRFAIGKGATLSESERDRLRTKACELGDPASCEVLRAGCAQDFAAILGGLRAFMHPGLEAREVEREFGVRLDAAGWARPTGCWSLVGRVPEGDVTTLAVGPGHACIRRADVHKVLGEPQTMNASGALPFESWRRIDAAAANEGILVQYLSFDGCVFAVELTE